MKNKPNAPTWYLHSFIQKTLDEFCGNTISVSRKTNYVVIYSFLTPFLMNVLSSNRGFLDYDRMEDLILKQTFVSIFEIKEEKIIVLNKKRLKRFIKQNQNRFKISAKKLNKKYDKIISEFQEDNF